MNDKSRLTYRFRYLLITILGIFCCINITAYAKNLGPEKKCLTTPVIDNPVSSEPLVYGIGSVSKIFGTAAVMKLVDEGKIDLDTPLTDYLPEFQMADERYKRITPKMLLNHSSGLMGTTSHNVFLYGPEGSDYHENFLKQLKKQELKAEPGEYSVYCNDGFMLAEILIERVSGMNFSDYINKNFSIPLGLKNTFTPMDGLDEHKIAPIYFNNHRMPLVNCQTLASGGIYGTSEDLCRFAQIFMKDAAANILSKKSADLMAKPWYLKDKICVNNGDNQMGYGLGWDSVNTYPYNLYNIKALSKSGDVNGYHSNLTVLPEQNLSIAVTASGGTSAYLQGAAQDIVLEVLKEEGLIDDIKDIRIQVENNIEAAPLPEEMKQYAGYYISKSTVKVEFNDAGVLLLTPIDSEYDTVQEYVYTKSGEFVSTKGYYLDSFGSLVSNANGNKGLTKFSFRKESNGKTYLIGTTYQSAMGLGETAYTTAFAEKIEPCKVPNNIMEKWKERSNNTYYIVGETFNSDCYLHDSILTFKPISEVSGYVTSYYKNESKNKCRIIDENTAKCEIDIPGMIGRDLTNYQFYQKGNAEYTSVGSLTYAEKSMVKSSAELLEGIVTIPDDLAAWYEISKEDAGSLIRIEVPAYGAYYVYDKDDNCIASSIFEEDSGSVMLPANGHIVFAGKKNAIFHISKE